MVDYKCLSHPPYLPWWPLSLSSVEFRISDTGLDTKCKVYINAHCYAKEVGQKNVLKNVVFRFYVPKEWPDPFLELLPVSENALGNLRIANVRTPGHGQSKRGLDELLCMLKKSGILNLQENQEL